MPFLGTSTPCMDFQGPSEGDVRSREACRDHDRVKVHVGVG